MLFIGLFIIAVSFMILCLNTPKTMLFIIVLGLLLWFNPGHATEVIGVGTGSCTQLSKEYQKNPTTAFNRFYTWYEGFVTGLNLLLDPPRNLDMKYLNVTDQWAALRAYCDKHPLVGFYEAAAKVMSDLPLREQTEPLTKFKQ